jgi:hypothetical protein
MENGKKINKKNAFKNKPEIRKLTFPLLLIQNSDAGL